MSTVTVRSHELEYDPVRLERLLWGLVAVGFVGDLVTTVVGLQLGLSESNAFVAASLASYGVPAIVAIKSASVLFGWLCRRLLYPEHRWIIPTCLSVPWLVATVYNLYLIVVVTA